jgi:hypothetical protein
LQVPDTHWLLSVQGALKQPVGWEQTKAPHDVAAQTPPTSHVAWTHASIIDWVMHVPLGSTVPGTTSWHPPSKPGTAQLRQVPQLVGLVQHTLSMHVPLAH